MRNRINQIISLIFTMRQLVQEQTTPKKGKGFSFLQFNTLRYIKERRPLMKDLADYLMITPPSATSIIDTLAESGSVERMRDPEDRRIVRIVITKKGEEQLKKFTNKMVDRMRKNLKSLTKNEQQALADILSKIIEVNNSNN
ncbi:MAG: MarR family transcriptional regulator [Parcubacteria group bacterium]